MAQIIYSIVMIIFLLSHVIALLINYKMQQKQKAKNINNKSTGFALQLNEFTHRICGAKEEKDYGVPIDKIVQHLEEKDISFDYSKLINGFIR